ncbi:MAG: threonylcarbamoyl-AMP synthase [Rhodobacteraceae bacterium]|nr:threonylcarbamoyl-AMP synthase [Paracoccaceae bacterium]
MKTAQLSGNKGGVAQAVTVLQNGGTVAFATETVYGLGADARNSAAVAAIFSAKDRPSFNPLIVHLACIEMLESIAELPKAAQKLLPLWPGPLTLVLPRKQDSGLSDLVTAGLDTVAVRIPAHPLARELLRRFGGPVAAPSANPSGKVSATSAAHVLAGLDGRIAAILDGGDCAVGLESTIVGFEHGTAVLLRPGGVSVEDIEALLGENLALPTAKEITAPGQLSSHYAPDVAVRMNAENPLTGEAWLGFGQHPRTAPGLNLSSTGNLTEAATNLFDALRKMDAICKREGLKGFAVAPIPQTGLGLAINDRLKRASAKRGRHPLTKV